MASIAYDMGGSLKIRYSQANPGRMKKLPMINVAARVFKVAVGAAVSIQVKESPLSSMIPSG